VRLRKLDRAAQKAEYAGRGAPKVFSMGMIASLIATSHFKLLRVFVLPFGS
jgi:hypothetical protein